MKLFNILVHTDYEDSKVYTLAVKDSITNTYKLKMELKEVGLEMFDNGNFTIYDIFWFAEKNGSHVLENHEIFKITIPTIETDWRERLIDMK